MTCGKAPFPSKKKARIAARRRTTAAGGRAILPYHCSRCDAWHIGHDWSGSAEPCRTCRAPIVLGPYPDGHGLGPMEPTTGKPHHCAKEAA